MTSLLSGQPHNTISNPNHLVTHDWGLNKNTTNRIFTYFVTKGGNIKRKTRSDQGSNIFPSHKKENNTSLHSTCIKKHHTNQPRDCYTPLIRTDLQEEWK